jgi:hypothetical protein
MAKLSSHCGVDLEDLLARCRIPENSGMVITVDMQRARIRLGKI